MRKTQKKLIMLCGNPWLKLSNLKDTITGKFIISSCLPKVSSVVICGEEHVNLKPVGQIYSGRELILDTSNTLKFIAQVSKICSPPE